MTRIYEHQMDSLFAAALLGRPAFAQAFLAAVDGQPGNGIIAIERQAKHCGPAHRGSIDLVLTRADGSLLLVENKIDAAYSITRTGDAQPERYRASVATLRDGGTSAASVLLAPALYLQSTRQGSAFDHQVSYEALRGGLDGAGAQLLEAAILQAATPYEPLPNDASAAFFAAFKDYTRREFPDLIVKPGPNGSGVRPSGSRTIYFDVPRTLTHWPDLPRPRMSLQCHDSGAPSASVKIMIGGMAAQAKARPVPQSLKAIGAYMRPAGRSLGLAIDTPRLETQTAFDTQMREVREALAAGLRLKHWWNQHAADLAVP